MHKKCRSGARLGVLGFVVLWSCTDTPVTAPVDGPSIVPSFSLFSGDRFEAEGFYFVPPVVGEAPTIVGTFNPALLPAMSVCELSTPPGPVAVCVEGDPIAYLPPGSTTVELEEYAFAWDTDGEETGDLDHERFYRLHVLIADEVLGWIDLDPAHPLDPDPFFVPETYGFVIGDTVPVTFWLGVQVLCEGEGFVTECIAAAVIDEDGGTLTLEGEGDRLAITIFEGSLPGDNHPPLTVTVERINPAAFLAETGSECLPLFDAPQFSDCFRISTIPELEADLDSPALVSICLDPTLLDGINLSAEQQNQLTMVRFDDSGADAWEALPDVAGDCPTIVGSLLPVPDDGILRFLAIGINAVVDFIGPQKVAARDIRLGGLTSSFSRFRYALPGQMIPGDGDGSLIQVGGSVEVEAVIEVVDYEGVAVENAIVHFETGDGTLSSPQVISDSEGLATVTWTVDNLTPGQKTLTASALGLLADEVPEHSSAYFFTTEEVFYSVTVVGPPAEVVPSPSSTIEGVAGESAGNVSISVTDADGNPVSGLAVNWAGDGQVVGAESTDAEGNATGEWILSTDAGDNSITATVGGLTAVFTAVVAPGAAADLNPDGNGVTAPAGSTIPISITVTDQYGNGLGGQAVAWTVTGGGGLVEGGGETDPDGSAVASWTLGVEPGPNTITVSAAGLDADLLATGSCLAGFGSADVDGTFDSGEWSCATSLDFVITADRRHDDDDDDGDDDRDDDDDDDDDNDDDDDDRRRGRPDRVRARGTIYWMNDGTHLYFGVQVEGRALRRASSLRIDIDNDGDGRPEVGDDILGYDVRRLRVVDEHLTRRCVRRRGQSNCGSRDRSVDVTGAASNDGTYTTYEISQPLGGDQRGQDLVVSPGDEIGFFLTLHNGRGAKANIRVPGFREYQSITIVGGT